MSHGIPIDLKPERATADMPPPFPCLALRIGIVVKIIGPGLVGFPIRIDWPLPLRFSAADKFIFISESAPGTRYL
jgi:hypothetical protein